MRPIAITFVACLFLALAFAPAVTAKSPQPSCYPIGVGDKWGTPSVKRGEDCRYHVKVNEGIHCLGGSVGSTSTPHGSVTVTVYYCRSPNQPGPA